MIIVDLLYIFKAIVDGVVDWATIHVTIDYGMRTYLDHPERDLGDYTPERKQNNLNRAKEFLTHKSEGKDCLIQTYKDASFSTSLAKVFYKKRPPYKNIIDELFKTGLLNLKSFWNPVVDNSYRIYAILL
ncbi:nuclease [Staphylococcus phage vB_SauH_DELF3]|nr:nuclease [Staphylococcus phage vB_SauH_DELF3]